MTTTAHLGKPDELPISQLRLDPLNPRLPQSYQGAPEETLLKWIVETYNALEVARSIALHGYFPSEPLILQRQFIWNGDFLGQLEPDNVLP